MKTKIHRWGNSLAVRIPKPFAESAGLKASSEVQMSLEGDEVRLTPVRHRWDLRRMLARVTKGNTHGEVESGPAVGREAW